MATDRRPSGAENPSDRRRGARPGHPVRADVSVLIRRLLDVTRTLRVGRAVQGTSSSWMSSRAPDFADTPSGSSPVGGARDAAYREAQHPADDRPRDQRRRDDSERGVLRPTHGTARGTAGSARRGLHPTRAARAARGPGRNTPRLIAGPRRSCASRGAGSKDYTSRKKVLSSQRHTCRMSPRGPTSY